MAFSESVKQQAYERAGGGVNALLKAVLIILAGAMPCYAVVGMHITKRLSHVGAPIRFQIAWRCASLVTEIPEPMGHSCLRSIAI